VISWSGRWPVRYLIATITVALPIAVLEKLRPELTQTSIALILVPPVILVAVTQGRGPALYASTLVGLSFNFFFIGPYYSFLITRPEDVVAFIVFVSTAVLVGQLSSRLEKRVLLTEKQSQELVHVRGKFERAAAQAAEADALRKSEQLKTALLDAVTHDLRTPLTSIKAAISTIRAESVSPEVQRELFEVIEEESDRLNHFIQGMMDLAKLQAGEVTLASRNVAPEEMVEDALLRAGPLLEGHPVEVNIASGLPSPKVDPRLISQVIFTLLENAAKYSGASAKITVSVRQKENNICFAVDDEGPGIPSELRGKVFDKFFRAGLQPGLGMGLAIARGIVQAHGGKIWIEDGPERRGTSVQFMVPLSDAPAIQTSKNDVPQNDVPQNDVAQRDVPRNDDAATSCSPRVVTSGEHS
jgi:K+-sensing histidine kinase KdpD